MAKCITSNCLREATCMNETLCVQCWEAYDKKRERDFVQTDRSQIRAGLRKAMEAHSSPAKPRTPRKGTEGWVQL